MKTIFFFILTAICATTLFFPYTSFAQDSPQWHLPEGATARLGKGWLSEIQYSPDGTRLAAAGSLGVWIYDTVTDKEIALFTGYGYGISALTYSPDGSMLAGGSWDGTVRLWDPETGEVLHSLEKHRRSVRSLVFSSDGSVLASASRDDTIGLQSRWQDAREWWYGTTIASGSFDGTVLLWKFPVVMVATEVLGDLNGDGVVNVQDVVLIATSFGEAGENNADLNGDGVVNVQDLVLIANAFANIAGAPSAHASLSAAQVEQWLRLAKGEASQSLQTSIPDRFSYERGIQVLERLLRTLAPQRTVLLANYPNPFNPETWIPYQLAVPADVSISIYATDGRLVRTLALGHQPVGIYESRSRAAYWDGRNSVGESVASGVYFYTLTAGDFTATRKMLILK